MIHDVQDLANQIRWSKQYMKACKEAAVPVGLHLTTAAAEWFSGVPANWTSLDHKVSKDMVSSMFPHATSKDR